MVIPLHILGGHLTSINACGGGGQGLEFKSPRMSFTHIYT